MLVILMEGNMEDIKEIYLKAQERLKRTDFFSTGYEDLDNFCKYIDKGNVITIGGRPAMGKTNFSVSLINHMVNADKNCNYHIALQYDVIFALRFHLSLILLLCFLSGSLVSGPYT